MNPNYTPYFITLSATLESIDESLKEISESLKGND